MLTRQELLDKVRCYAPDADVQHLERAYQRVRKIDGGALGTVDTSVQRSLSVADLLADLRLDVDTVAAGLLFPSVEEGRLTESQIEEEFGEEIAELVRGTCQLAQVNYRSSAEHQAEAFRKMIFAMSSDLRVLLVRLADRLYTLRLLKHGGGVRRGRLAEETLDIYAPIANRLGIQTFKSELEDLAFAILHTRRYEALEEKLSSRREVSDRFIGRITDALEQIAEEQQIQATVYGRLKHTSSIHNKMQNKQLDFDEVADLVAFRVIVDDVASCYAMLGAVHARWEPIHDRFKDFIGQPKSNGYQSLHTTVLGKQGERFEVQIRSQEMHEVAELGIAAHWRYKEGHLALSPKEMDRISRVGELSRMVAEIQDPQEFVEMVKVDLFADEVYVYTPQGEVKWFPLGSTALDFAYSVHSEVGKHAVGARVHGQMVPLRYKLQSGDRVEVLTRKDQVPSRDWMRMVVSHRARAKIRAYLHKEARQKARQEGYDSLEAELKKHDLKLNKVLKSVEFARVLEQVRARNADELCVRIGYGSLALFKVMEVLAPEPEDEEEFCLPAMDEGATRKRAAGARSTVRVHGLEGMLTTIARCCRPVPGDAIVGYITRGRGITVHRVDCPQATRLDPNRTIPTEWTRGTGEAQYTRIRMVMQDRTGMLATVTKRIGLMKINIISCDVQIGDDGFGTVFVGLEVRDRSQLRSVIQKLSEIPGVVEVARS